MLNHCDLYGCLHTVNADTPWAGMEMSQTSYSSQSGGSLGRGVPPSEDSELFLQALAAEAPPPLAAKVSHSRRSSSESSSGWSENSAEECAWESSDEGSEGKHGRHKGPAPMNGRSRDCLSGMFHVIDCREFV